jgi:hypothetical protein
MNEKLVSFLTLIRRYPFAASCVLATIALAAGAWYFETHIEELEAAAEEQGNEGTAMLKLLAGGSTQRQELAFVRDITRRIDENLVIEGNLAENVWYFYKLEEQTKARLELHPLNWPNTDSSPLFRRAPFTLHLSGGFEQVIGFLLGLETGPRLVKITSFTFASRDAGGNNVELELSLEMLGKK